MEELRVTVSRLKPSLRSPAEKWGFVFQELCHFRRGHPVCFDPLVEV